MSDRINQIDVTQEIIDYIKKNIISGHWVEGEPIESELKMAERLGVSRSSVRLAMRHFIAEGVLESMRGKGTFLRKSTFWKTRDLFANDQYIFNLSELMQFRLAIEPECAELAAQAATAEDIQVLRSLIAESKNTSDLHVFMKYDLEFHIQIARMTGNHLFEKVLRQLFEQNFDTFMKTTFKHGTMSSFYYHPKILSALDKKNPKSARKIMREHLLHVEKIL